MKPVGRWKQNCIRENPKSGMVIPEFRGVHSTASIAQETLREERDPASVNETQRR